MQCTSGTKYYSQIPGNYVPPKSLVQCLVTACCLYFSPFLPHNFKMYMFIVQACPFYVLQSLVFTSVHFLTSKLSTDASCSSMFMCFVLQSLKAYAQTEVSSNCKVAEKVRHEHLCVMSQLKVNKVC